MQPAFTAALLPAWAHLFRLHMSSAQNVTCHRCLPSSCPLLPLQAFLQQQEEGLRFDAAHLRSPALETVHAQLPATSLTPLVREPGRVVVSDARLYFQPQHNISGDTPVRTHPLAAVAAVARRRSSLRDVGKCWLSAVQGHGSRVLLGQVFGRARRVSGDKP